MVLSPATVHEQIPEPAPSPPVTARRWLGADPGLTWLNRFFEGIHARALETSESLPTTFARWLEYKRRSASLNPENWLAFYSEGEPVGMAQGAGVARVFHTHFLFIQATSRPAPLIGGALRELQEAARRRRCHTLSLEGPNTGGLLRLLGPEHLVAAGFAWHERLRLRLPLQGSSPPGRTHTNSSVSGVVGLRLGPEVVARLMHLESAAFLHAACDHPGELPLDFTDGYRTSLLPMQSLSAMYEDETGEIRGALYAEKQGDAAVIHALFVDPSWRNRGIAQALLRHCLEIHGAAGLSATELTVLADNGPAVHLYQSAGFQEVSRSDLFIKRLPPT